jgi:hypothetical protein
MLENRRIFIFQDDYHNSEPIPQGTPIVGRNHEGRLYQLKENERLQEKTFHSTDGNNKLTFSTAQMYTVSYTDKLPSYSRGKVKSATGYIDSYSSTPTLMNVTITYEGEAPTEDNLVDGFEITFIPGIKISDEHQEVLYHEPTAPQRKQLSDGAAL